MKTDAKVLVGAVLATLVTLGGGIAWVSSDKAPQRQEQGSATMTIDKKEEDFGDMKADEERTATFTITNTSAKYLRIWGVATSCDCTFASVIIGDKTTGEFNMTMHMGKDLRNWIGEIPPNGKALLKVTYRPKVMPVTGPVTRQVTFSTNDPNYQNVEVGIKANVL